MFVCVCGDCGMDLTGAYDQDVQILIGLSIPHHENLAIQSLTRDQDVKNGTDVLHIQKKRYTLDTYNRPKRSNQSRWKSRWHCISFSDSG